MDKLLNIKEACRLLRISQSTIRRWIINKKLPCYRVDLQYIFLESELKEFILKHKVK
jgi:PTS system nitrogen regulatory IIA component